MSGLQLLFLASILVFVIGVLLRAVKLARMPLHLRWDLYPIPHEKGKGHYGGSYYEEVDWWTKPAQISRVAELKAMAKEILFIQSMYHHNRPLWLFSFPFHFGLYLLIVFVLLIGLGGILKLSGGAVSPESSSGLTAAIYHATIVFGVAGAFAGALGALGLLASRVFKAELRRTSVWSDYFNIVLLLAVFVSLLWMWSTVDPGFSMARGFIAGLISFSSAPPLAGVARLHFILAAVFLLWLPFTHMTHFVGKYFTYHSIRWEDHPNIKGSRLERAVIEALGNKITWSAPHIRTGGTWAEAATEAEADTEGGRQ
jgi:nitrate reductase gamma subunit